MRGAIASVHRAPRFNRGLDMLMGKAEREDDSRPFPQKPQAVYLPDMPYQLFCLSEDLLWVKEVEAATDAIEAELTAFLASRVQVFAPYFHGGLELSGQTSDTHKDHDNWAAAFLVRDGEEDLEWSTSCPTVSGLRVGDERRDALRSLGLRRLH